MRLYSNQFEIELKRYFLSAEDVISTWKSGINNSKNLWEYFDVECFPEPYLTYKSGTFPLLFLTHNPGKALKFQRLDQILSGRSVISYADDYKHNALALAQYYFGNSAQGMTSASKTRVAALMDFARHFVCDGVMQVELFPLHSTKRPPDRYLFEFQPLGQIFDGYRSSLKSLLACAPIIIASCGSRPDKNGVTVKKWLKCLNVSEIGSVVETNEKRTVGAIIGMTSNGYLRILICRSGSNGFPAEQGRKSIISSARLFSAQSLR